MRRRRRRDQQHGSSGESRDGGDSRHPTHRRTRRGTPMTLNRSLTSRPRIGLGSTRRRRCLAHHPGRGRGDGANRRKRRPAQVFLLRQEPEAGPAAHRRAGRLHLRRVRRAVQRDHRGASGRGRRRDLERVRTAEAARDLLLPRGVRHRPGGAKRALSSPSTTTTSGFGPATRITRRRRHRRRRDRQVQHPAHRADGLRQDLSRADSREAPQRAVRRRRRHRADRGRLRR